MSTTDSVNETKRGRGRPPTFTEKMQQDLLLGELRAHMTTYGSKSPSEPAQIKLSIGSTTFSFRVQRDVPPDAASVVLENYTAPA